MNSLKKYIEIRKLNKGNNLLAKKNAIKTDKSAQGYHVDFALHTIGWKAFQDLSAQICEQELSTPIELFREAQDGGQDAVFLIPSKNNTEAVIGTVQCKHVSDAKKTLKLSDLTPELDHVKQLVSDGQANTYIFVTNMSVDAPVAVAMKASLKELGVKNPHVWGKQKIVQTIRKSARLRALVPLVYGLGDLSVILDERIIEQTKALLSNWLPKLRSYVATTCHQKAVKSLEASGAVLLLGNPSTGKSAIGAILSTIASERHEQVVLKLTSPKEFEDHWNANEKGRFYWIDDAFGSNIVRSDYVNDWSSLFGKVQTAIAMDNRFLFTSRRHIYLAAKFRLGQRNLPMFLDESAVVDVGDLSLSEKLQILYNHVNNGDQEKVWKSAVKPFLASVADTESFLPGIAERLGKKAFTKSLPLTEKSLINFMSAPKEHLIETINVLDDASKAALALVYVHQGRFPASSPDRSAAQAVTDAYGVSFSEMCNRLEELEGSFLKSEYVNENIEWSFEHPTISDALTSILGERPHMVEALLRGASIDTVLENFVCEGMPPIQDAAVISSSLHNVLKDRLVTTPDEPSRNRSLFNFLVDRANDDFFRLLVQADPYLLNRTAVMSARLWFDPKINCHARALSFGLISEELREETAARLEDAALTDFDVSFFESPNILALISPDRLVGLGLNLRRKLETDAEEIVSDIGNDADLDDDAESHFERIKDCLHIIQMMSFSNYDDDPLPVEIESMIQTEVEILREKQEEKRAEEDEDNDVDWSIVESASVSSTTKVENEAKEVQRSIFTDVDS